MTNTQSISKLREKTENSLHNMGKIYVSWPREDRSDYRKKYTDEILGAVAETLESVEMPQMKHTWDFKDFRASMRIGRTNGYNQALAECKAIVDTLKSQLLESAS